MKSDQEIWEGSLKDKDTVDLFKTEPGGPNVKPLPKPKTFEKTKLEIRVEELEKQIELLTKQVKENTNKIRKLLK